MHTVCLSLSVVGLMTVVRSKARFPRCRCVRLIHVLRLSGKICRKEKTACRIQCTHRRKCKALRQACHTCRSLRRKCKQCNCVKWLVARIEHGSFSRNVRKLMSQSQMTMLLTNRGHQHKRS